MTGFLLSATRLGLLAAAVAGCTEVGSSGPADPAPVRTPPGMREACISQAVRLTSVPQSDIVAAAPITVGPYNRPFIGLTVAGASYGCRIEDDGSYTVFSQYAN